MPEHVLVVGASLAGYKAVKELRTLGFEGHITLVGDEPEPPYDRPPLSKSYLTGACDAASVALSGSEDLDALDVDLVLGTRAVAVDPPNHRVFLDDGDDLAYGHLLVATGARARRPDWFRDLPGLHLLRSLRDAKTIRSGLRHDDPIVVVGGGFIGTEAAAALVSAGRDVTLVAEGRQVLEPLGPFAAGILTDMHRAHGVRLRCGRQVIAVDGRTRVESVTLDDGTVLPAGIVLVATGARPNSEWLGGLADPATGAVPADPPGQVADAIWAAGDVTTTGAGHWFGAVRQARRAVRGILGVEDRATERLDTEMPYFWTDQFDLKVQVVGSARGATAVPLLHDQEPASRIISLYERDGVVTGVLAAGRPRDLATARSIVTARDDPATAAARFTEPARV